MYVYRFKTTHLNIETVEIPSKRRTLATYATQQFPIMATTPSPPPMSPPVNPGRVRTLKEGSGKTGPVVYWMFRDQRLKDNWALIHAVHQANKAKVPVAVVFNLFDHFLGAKARHLGFMLKGLRQLCLQLQHSLQIPFFLVRVYLYSTLFLLQSSYFNYGSVWYRL